MNFIQGTSCHFMDYSVHMVNIQQIILLKDLYLLRHTQIMVNVLVSFDSAILITLNASPASRIGFLTGMLMIGLSIPVASTVYFDQSYEFYKMAAISPVSRRLYIIEKYLLVLLISSAVFLCGLLCFELYRFSIFCPIYFICSSFI